MLRRVRRGLALAIALLSIVPAAAAARRDVVVQAAPTSGRAPLIVTFVAAGGRTSAHGVFGDGGAADGLTTQHTYGAGAWTATWTAQTPSGERSGTVQITATGLTFAAPRRVKYGARAIFTGVVFPAEQGVRIGLAGPRGRLGTTTSGPNGGYTFHARVRAPGDYSTSSDRGSSVPQPVRVVPRLLTSLVGSGARDTPYELSARVVPAGAGSLAVKVRRGATTVVDHTYATRVRLRLSTRSLVTYRIRVGVVPSNGYVATARTLVARVVLPRIAFGMTGSPVAQLAAGLRALHYVAPVTSTFDSRLLDSVYAFEKVQGLPRTGIADAAFWRRLADPLIPRPRYRSPADHLEVNKPSQVLYVVRHGQIAQIIPVSTAGLPGKFTPVGRFSIIRKVNGFDPSPLGTLYDPMYFVGGYAIHGNPSVPPYPASHGCVRVPMWIAAYLFAANPYGETVYVY
jgi:L,D-transpeptidase catalytic domain/Putative peptidoglycan binding domain